jgi:hypothetical protein
MAHLILHIGTHKTASTTLQDTLAANRAALARQGVVYPKIGQATGHHTLATHWIDLPAIYHEPEPAAAHWQGLAAHARDGATVILSSEEFSRWKPQAVDFAEVRRFAAPFARTTVVCFLRNQLGFIQSIYLQMAKRAPPNSFESLIAGALAGNHAAGMFLDYGQLHAHVARGFPEAEILFLPYEAACRHPGGLVGCFLERVGLGALRVEAAPDANVSPDPLGLWVASHIADPDAADAALIARVEAALAASFPGRNRTDRRTTVFTPAEAARLAAHFEPLNRAFEAACRQRHPDFALAPLDLGRTPIHRNELGNGFWIQLIRTLDRPLPRRRRLWRRLVNRLRGGPRPWL